MDGVIIEDKKFNFEKEDVTSIALHGFHVHLKCNSIPVKCGFFPGRIIDKEMWEGSFHQLSQHL